ncbi:hypothetical protein ARMGADRAFT_1007375 [Armillaria gallica]|uniref:Uncharacterized protein n=1 Tax=Armillaria gallica TaxID=47427 RepID=A0A2H3E1N1_ARMGA|nr:hypothetical protein ARMGADRAFT_1007375 [Armillaria gallica]
MSESDNMLPQSLEEDLQADRTSDSGETSDTDNRDTDSSDTDTPLLPKVTISSQTETGQTEESVKVPLQRAYTGRKPVISSSLANTPCSSLGIQGLLDLLNTTLGTSRTLDTPSLSSNYDFGTAYGHLRSAWCDSGLQIREANALVGSRIVRANMNPRRVWDLCSNRVVHFFSLKNGARPISHAWVNDVDRVDVWTPINGYEWPVPIPKGANLDLIRIEMLNLGVEYTQRGGLREDLRVEEWKLDVPTIGVIYRYAHVEGDLESDRLQEVGWERTIAGDTPGGPLHIKPIDEAGNYKDEILTRFHKQLKSAEISNINDRISTNPVDKVAGLAFFLWTCSIPAYYESQSLEDAWTALINETHSYYLSILFFTYPEPGTGYKKWRPSWEQVMTKPLPNGSRLIDGFWRDDDDWCEGFNIESEEGIDRCGETAHTFNILASHQYPIPEDTYTLIGGIPFGTDKIYPSQYWVVGRRLPSKMFEKVSVFKMTDSKEIKQLKYLGLYAKSHSILA